MRTEAVVRERRKFEDVTHELKDGGRAKSRNTGGLWKLAKAGRLTDLRVSWRNAGLMTS